MKKDNSQPSNSSQCSLDLVNCKTDDISEYLDDLVPLLEEELDIKLKKVKRFSFIYNMNGEDIYFNFFKSPLNYEYNSYQINSTLETVCVFYLFNYYNAEQLGLAIKSFLQEVVLMGKLRLISGKDGYYDIRFSKHTFVQAYDLYKVKVNENLQYFYFKDTLATRKTVFDFKNLMKELVVDISTIPHLSVEKAVQSEDSEACYITVNYKNKKVKKNMKVSIRNHPINTKSQMCIYAYNYDDLGHLKHHLMKALKEFNWHNYQFSVNQYYDVKPDSIVLKNSGHDLCKYSKEQIEFISDSKIKKNNNSKSYQYNVNYY